jgi:hypothetical protein
MNRGRVGEERGSKETDGCPLTGYKTLEVFYRKNDRSNFHKKYQQCCHKYYREHM